MLVITLAVTTATAITAATVVSVAIRSALVPFLYINSRPDVYDPRVRSDAMDTTDPSDREPTEVIDGVHLAQLAAGERMSVQHFRIEPGATVPEHDHPHEQTGFIYGGELTFLVDGEEFVVGEGGSYAIPGDEPHAAENRGETTVLGVDVFSPPRLDVPWK